MSQRRAKQRAKSCSLEKEKVGGRIRDSRGRGLHRVKAIDPPFPYPPSPPCISDSLSLSRYDKNPLLSRSTQRNGEKVSIELILGLVGASPISRIISIRGKNEKKQIYSVPLGAKVACFLILSRIFLRNLDYSESCTCIN